MKRMHSMFHAVVLMFVCLFLVMPALAKQPDDFSYEEWRAKLRQQGLFDETVMVPMRDGVNLSTTIFKSPLGGPYPAVLVRTPYGKDDERLEDLQMVLLLGYSLVIQDVRGRFDSEGDDMVFVNDGWGELQDGYDTVEWIAAQSWCNGRVGTWGPSAMGIVQGLMAPTRPPHLVCQVIGYSASQIYSQAAYQSGVYRKALVNGWLNGIDAFHLLTTFLEHPYNDDFWDQMNMESRYSEVNVPSLFIGGWYDCFQQGTLHDFVGRQNNGMDGAKGNQKLVIGPWTHTNEWDQEQGQLEYPEDSQFNDEINMTIEWFNYWLKGENNTIMSEPAVQYYVMGDVSDPNAPGNEWRTSDVWPVAAQETAFYLQPDGSLSTSGSASGKLDLPMNPDQPVTTLGGANLDISAGPYDQSSLESREDVLVFSTSPLDEAVEITGRIHLTLYAESNLTDNDITVRVTDVYPDGRSMLVCDGIARASFPEPYTNSSPITPGEVNAYEIDCWSTSLVFNQGHRIRIIVANTNSPRFDVNPVYQQLGQNGLPDEAVTVIHCAQEYPSALYLPIVGDFTSVREWPLHELD